ncbi:putative Holliday junction resolvase [Tamilnaduibacter salinus]|uniref:Putative pre-16S rRNA nuclease n=1 Tax=Tamilnaduibacter salinus TaxID=1484056 RepID=A0A2U1CYY1_9GAMM|nr:Holliday junction resolvase RuvX [Tamilnaduibacter salinus]PVY77627.1 putative Holliday junction resolvase [Tamilnaduibacter salinus]
MPEFQHQRALGFDFGDRRIGVASGQTLSGTAGPLTMLPARDGIPDWSRIEALISEWQPDVLVVGLPLNMDGSESEMSRRARKFGRRLEAWYGRPVVMVDERLTSYEAKGQVMAEGGSQDFGRDGVDDRAAVLILQTWLTGG